MNPLYSKAIAPPPPAPPPLRRLNRVGRNDPCPCGSGRKWKKCCNAPVQPQSGPRLTYIDTGEDAIRWVICDSRGTSFFADKDNRVLVFTDKALAFAVASLGEFSGQEAGDINIAGVGPTKYANLQEKLPYVEVSDIEVAVEIIRERIAARSAAAEEPADGCGNCPNEGECQKGEEKPRKCCGGSCHKAAPPADDATGG